MSNNLLKDYFAARNYGSWGQAPNFGSVMSSNRSPWQSVLPLVDDRGFLITLIPENHRLYREMVHRWQMTRHQEYELVVGYVLEDFVREHTVIEEAVYYKMRFQVLPLPSRYRDAEDRNLFVAMTPNFCEALFNDGSLPDLRGAFRY